ncbi:hypothetical protein [Methylobacterium sp. J-070]|uniref:hypothetical protein n=1 Tax=Methylobacterium sp. J-070 TaxID=2836650 RepID=UPI001FB88B67|nr:hypothetical protein [Methylobacterium sp. J-070]MCJ2049215.1 hypothetical protein [Methylobacterium sp. J-070]
MPDEATLWDLVIDERIAIEDLSAAVDLYLADPTTQDHPIGPHHSLDLAAAVAAHAVAPATMRDGEADEPARRMAVRAALLMARPTARARPRGGQAPGGCPGPGAAGPGVATRRRRR